MKSHALCKFIFVIFVLICSVLFFETMASGFDFENHTFSKSGSDFSSTPVEINIISPQVVLQGREMQMEFEASTSGVYVPVEWSSSNQDVISCTKDGKIKGVTKGRATITVKAKNDKSSDSITVYCVKRFNESEDAEIKIPLFWINKTPVFFDIEKIIFDLVSYVWGGIKVTVLGYYDDYFYVEYKDGEGDSYGLIWSNFFWNSTGSKEIFRQLSYYNITLKTGESSAEKLTTKYKGDVDWTVSDKNIISFDKNTGKITAKKPGTAIITAQVGTTKKSCIVYSVSQWLEPETAVAAKDVTVRKTPSFTGEKAGTVLKGSRMTADGDLENGTRWVYITSGNISGFVQLSDFPGINYLMTEYHYYDQGFEKRFSSGYEKIRDYSSVLNDIMMRIFGLKINQHIEEYTSLADECKIKTYGSVYKNNLDFACSKSNGHNASSCLNYKEIRSDFLTDKGQGSDWIGKCLWTGHTLEPSGVSSVTHTLYKTIFFNSLGVQVAINNNKELDKEYVIRTRFLIEIIHETAHLLGAEDGYCNKDGGSDGHCSNEHCYVCNELPKPECIMVEFDGNVEYSDTIFCSECIETINKHLSNHH